MKGLNISKAQILATAKLSIFLQNKVPFEQIKLKQLNAPWVSNLEEATYLNSGIFGISHWRLSFRGINYLNFTLYKKFGHIYLTII